MWPPVVIRRFGIIHENKLLFAKMCEEMRVTMKKGKQKNNATTRAGAYSTYGEGEVMYCFSDRQLGEWFDSTREEIVKILSSICEEMGMPGLHFPRNKYRW